MVRLVFDSVKFPLQRMSLLNIYLKADQPRARWKRLDTARILKRFYFCERSLVISCSAWLPHIESLKIKTMLPYFSWQNAKTTNELRNRVFELRFPSRLLEEQGADRPLAAAFGFLRQAPSVSALLCALAQVALPALRDAYDEFLRHSDPLADAPTYRFLELGLAEKQKQITTIGQWAEDELGRNLSERQTTERWVSSMARLLEELGGVGTDEAPTSLEVEPPQGSQPIRIPDKPARDPRYWPCRFYWPDVVDPEFPYGEGLLLQLRSAVSHLNEVWAVEHGGIMLSEFADDLPWEWIHDAARWTYDEARHCRMGQERLTAWGFDCAEIPLGSYIYESANGEDPIYRLGMLYFFETKNIGRKSERAAAFKQIGDDVSEHDMEFDWADETIHATYGNRWLKALYEANSEKIPSPEQVRKRCEELVQRMIQSATTEEKVAITERALGLINQAKQMAGQS
jgi:uncharacterized ferritin-like protein (DUF455 family)